MLCGELLRLVVASDIENGHTNISKTAADFFGHMSALMKFCVTLNI